MIRTRVISPRWSASSSAASSAERRRPFLGDSPGVTARGLGRANRVLGRSHRPVVGENLVAQPELLGDRRQREQRPRVAHREPAAAQVGLDLLRQPQAGAEQLAIDVRSLPIRWASSSWVQPNSARSFW